MDQEFKKLVISDHEGTDAENKQAFLKLLKFQPEKLLQVFSDNIHSWMLNAGQRLERVIHLDLENDPNELLKAFQEHFAKELAEITKPV